MSMIALTLVPATLLFLFAFGLVNRSIDKWFSAPVDEIFRATDEMNRQWTVEHEAFARSILGHLGQQRELNLEQVRQDFKLQGLFVLDAVGNIIKSSTNETLTMGVVNDALSQLGNRTETYFDIPSGWVAVRRVDAPEGQATLVAVFPAPASITNLISRIAAERARYDELNENRKSYRDTYVYMLLLMTVLVLFAAVWIGLFLSKRITVLYAALSEATREIHPVS